MSTQQQPMTSQVVCLRVHYCTAFGECVHVAGTLWGDWQRPQPLRWREGSWWELAFCVPLPAAAADGDGASAAAAAEVEIEFKFFCRAAGGDVWEPCENRRLAVAAAREAMHVTCKWGHPDETAVAWGPTREEEAEIARRRSAEDAQARAAGLRFFAASIAHTMEESARRRREQEEALLAAEAARREAELRLAERIRAKRLAIKQRRAASNSSSPASTPSTSPFMTPSLSPAVDDQ